MNETNRAIISSRIDSVDQFMAGDLDIAEVQDKLQVSFICWSGNLRISFQRSASLRLTLRRFSSRYCLTSNGRLPCSGWVPFGLSCNPAWVQTDCSQMRARCE